MPDMNIPLPLLLAAAVGEEAKVGTDARWVQVQGRLQYSPQTWPDHRLHI